MNNGEPFYTDFDIFDSDEIRDGQLYNFLAKEKSVKRGDITKLGNYGQGSKLLYTLIAKVSESEENKTLLINTLYKEKKVLILSLGTTGINLPTSSKNKVFGYLHKQTIIRIISYL